VGVPPSQVAQSAVSSASSSGTTQLSYNLTISGAANRVVLIYVATNGAAPSVTFNGTSCSFVGSAFNDVLDERYNAVGCYGFLYVIKDSSLPPAGTYPVVLAFPYSTSVASIATMASGVSQSSTFGSGVSNASGPPTHSITSCLSNCISNGLAIDMVVVDANLAALWTPTSPQLARGLQRFGNTALAISDRVSTTGSVVMSGSSPSNVALAQYTVELRPAAGTAPLYLAEEYGAPSREVSRFSLRSVLPNPASSDRVVVRFSLINGPKADLDLFDLTGRRVHHEAVGWMGPGEHEATLRMDRLPAGVYLMRLSQGDQATVLKTTLLR